MLARGYAPFIRRVIGESTDVDTPQEGHYRTDTNNQTDYRCITKDKLAFYNDGLRSRASRASIQLAWYVRVLRTVNFCEPIDLLWTSIRRCGKCASACHGAVVSFVGEVSG